MHRLFIILLLLLATTFQGSAAIHWESMNTPVSQEIEMINTEQSRLGSASGCIYITVDQRIEVKVFTILGQMVITQTLEPGTYRLPISSRGIYIVKIGSSTHRIII